MRKLLWFIAGCIVFGVSLLAHLPAQLVFPEYWGKFQFLGVGGSLWRGKVEQVLFSGKALPIRTLNWTVSPAALFTGTLRANFHEQRTPTNSGNVGLSLRSRQLELKALHWQIPGSSLDPWFRAGVSLKGQFVLDLRTLRIPPNELFPSELEGRLDWKNAALQMYSEYWQVGSPLVQLSNEGEAIKGVATNSQPMLPGNGSFECTIKNCRVEMSLQPSRDAPRSVLNGLLLLGLQQTGNEFSGQIILPLDYP